METDIQIVPSFWLAIPFREFRDSIVKISKVDNRTYVIKKIGHKSKDEKVRVVSGKYMYAKNLFDTNRKLMKLEKVSDSEIVVRFYDSQ